MIRRRDGNDWLLITQNDHALLSGKLGAGIGNGDFSAPIPFESTVLGISLHDAGWSMHDCNPTVNSHGHPLHVFETPMPLSAKVWSASASAAEEKDTYAALLVSIHVLNLSAWVEQLLKKRKAEPNYRRDVFELIRFQQLEANRQVKLRKQLGLRTDLSLSYGLMKPGVSEVEDQLIFDLRYLQLCDRLSLILCTGEDLFASIPQIHPRLGAPAIEMKTSFSSSSPGTPGEERGGSLSGTDNAPSQTPTPALPRSTRGGGKSADTRGRALYVSPWPFTASTLSFDVPCRRLSARTFANDREYQEAYSLAIAESFSVTLASPAHG